jgi:poly(3-hydroxybutyrate) depolymerase
MKRRNLSILRIVLAAVFATAATGCSGSSSSSGSTCAATTITPYIYTNGAWVAEASATVTSTAATVNLGPQPLSGGSWSWSGPNGFTATTREIDAIKLSAGTNTYTATYTNSCGTKSTQTFTITVSASAVLTPGDYNETITSSGISRTFILHIPNGYTGTTAVPAILDFHPAGVNASYMEGMSGWKEKCDTVGCIVVYPESGDSNLLWDGGYCCDSYKDVQFARDIITWLKANTKLDAQRVYASGGSNGAALGYALACEASDVIAAAALVDFRCVTGSDPGSGGATMPPSNNTACTCPNIRPITIVEWEEQQDTTFVLYQGGVASTGLGLVGAVANIETFGYYSSCTGSPTPDTDNSLCETWTSCKDGVTETLCNHQSGSHLATYWDSSDHWNDVSWDRMSVRSLPLPK